MSLIVGTAMSYPSFTVPLLIPGIVVGIPGIICEMVGLAIFDKIDESLYEISPEHRKRFEYFAEQQEQQEQQDEPRAHWSRGIPQLGDFF